MIYIKTHPYQRSHQHLHLTAVICTESGENLLADRLDPYTIPVRIVEHGALPKLFPEEWMVQACHCQNIVLKYDCYGSIPEPLRCLVYDTVGAFLRKHKQNSLFVIQFIGMIEADPSITLEKIRDILTLAEMMT